MSSLVFINTKFNRPAWHFKSPQKSIRAPSSINKAQKHCWDKATCCICRRARDSAARAWVTFVAMRKCIAVDY